MAIRSSKAYLTGFRIFPFLSEVNFRGNTLKVPIAFLGGLIVYYYRVVRFKQRCV